MRALERSEYRTRGASVQRDDVGCCCRRVDRKIDRKRMANGPGYGWWTGDDDGLSSQVRRGFPGSWWTPVDGPALLDTQEARGSNPLRPTPAAPSVRLGAAVLTACPCIQLSWRGAPDRAARGGQRRPEAAGKVRRLLAWHVETGDSFRPDLLRRGPHEPAPPGLDRGQCSTLVEQLVPAVRPQHIDACDRVSTGQHRSDDHDGLGATVGPTDRVDRKPQMLIDELRDSERRRQRPRDREPAFATRSSSSKLVSVAARRCR